MLKKACHPHAVLTMQGPRYWKDAHRHLEAGRSEGLATWLWRRTGQNPQGRPAEPRANWRLREGRSLRSRTGCWQNSWGNVFSRLKGSRPHSGGQSTWLEVHWFQCYSSKNTFTETSRTMLMAQQKWIKLTIRSDFWMPIPKQLLVCLVSLNL